MSSVPDANAVTGLKNKTGYFGMAAPDSLACLLSAPGTLVWQGYFS